MPTTRANSSRHWVTNYVGKPFKHGEIGPNSFDCWGLVHYVYKHHFGIELPVYPFDHSDGKANSKTIQAALTNGDWMEVSQPKNGDVAVLGSNARSHHVGLWFALETGLIVHATKPYVAAETVLSIATKGMANIKFYRYKKWPKS